MKQTRRKFAIILYPISLIYGFIVSVRNWLYNANIFSEKEFNIPIISIGNITVGGTGKTPHSEYLIRTLKKDFNIALLSRGYKRKTRGFILSDNSSTVFDIGDEPLQIKNKFQDIQVAVCTKRVNGINQLLKRDTEKQLDFIILDDAYQHRAVKAGISILLMDFNNPIYEDHMLPYGDLRESFHEKYRANIVIVTKTPADIKPIERRIIEKNLNLFPYQSLYYSTIRYGNLVPLFNSERQLSDSEYKKYDCLVVTGIANPDTLYKHLEDTFKSIQKIKYADHHFFSKSDFEHIAQEYTDIVSSNKIIITTEKDAIRFKNSNYRDLLINLPIFYISIEIEFLQEDGITFNNQIINYVKKNKRSDKVHSREHKF